MSATYDSPSACHQYISVKCPSKEVVNSKRKKIRIIITLTRRTVVDSGPCATAVPLGGRTDVIGM